ncbi:unnamed protein product, partial [Effrenium voratum]
EFKFAREYIESQADTLLDELLAIVRTHSASEVNGYCKNRGWCEMTFLSFEHCEFTAACAQAPRICRAARRLEENGLRILRVSASLAGSPEVEPEKRRKLYIQPHASPEVGRQRLSCTLLVSPATSSTLRMEGEAPRVYRAGQCFWFDESLTHEMDFEALGPDTLRATLYLDALHPGYYQPREIFFWPAPGTLPWWQKVLQGLGRPLEKRQSAQLYIVPEKKQSQWIALALDAQNIRANICQRGDLGRLFHQEAFWHPWDPIRPLVMLQLFARMSLLEQMGAHDQDLLVLLDRSRHFTEKDLNELTQDTWYCLAAGCSCQALEMFGLCMDGVSDKLRSSLLQGFAVALHINVYFVEAWFAFLGLPHPPPFGYGFTFEQVKTLVRAKPDEDLCAGGAGGFCLYGAVSALFIAAAGLHEGISGVKTQPNPQQAQEYLLMATSLLGLQYCLDFQESSLWPIHANDVIANINRSAGDAFRLAGIGSPELPAREPPPGSSLSASAMPEFVRPASLGSTPSQVVAVVAVGTHPTLTLEAVSMLRDFGFGSERAVKVQRTLGITYKCSVFPEMCGEGMDTSEDSIAALIGRFESPPPYERYTLDAISQSVAAVARELDFDLLVCTSPFIVCALLQQCAGKPLLGYLGLPLLWKRPTDHFDNATARDRFWGLLAKLLESPEVVLATNNPLLTEQIAFQAGAVLPVVRPHARFTQAVYAPTRPNDAMLVSRTKFLWVTLDCALRLFLDDSYPIKFTIANSDSKLPFREMAAHRAVVLMPWEHALMAFFEFYSMGVPLLMPDADWSYRLIFDAEGNLGSTLPIYWDVSPSCGPHSCDSLHPYPPFAFGSFESRRYWYQYSSFAQFPHIQRFSSIPELLRQLLHLDLMAVSAAMKATGPLIRLHGQEAVCARNVDRVRARAGDVQIFVCQSTSCKGLGSEKLLRDLEASLVEKSGAKLRKLDFQVAEIKYEARRSKSSEDKMAKLDKGFKAIGGEPAASKEPRLAGSLLALRAEELLSSNGDAAAALRDAQQACALWTGFGPAHLSAALALLRLGEVDKAREEFQTAQDAGGSLNKDHMRMVIKQLAEAPKREAPAEGDVGAEEKRLVAAKSNKVKEAKPIGDAEPPVEVAPPTAAKVKAKTKPAAKKLQAEGNEPAEKPSEETAEVKKPSKKTKEPENEAAEPATKPKKPKEKEKEEKETSDAKEPPKKPKPKRTEESLEQTSAEPKESEKAKTLTKESIDAKAKVKKSKSSERKQESLPTESDGLTAMVDLMSIMSPCPDGELSDDGKLHEPGPSVRSAIGWALPRSIISL